MCLVGLAANEVRKSKATSRVSDSLLGSAVKSGDTPLGGIVAKKAGDLGAAQATKAEPQAPKAAKAVKKNANQALQIARKY